MLIELKNEAATLQLGQLMAACCPADLFTIYLKGYLGAGKTTFSRGLLQQLGHTGNVKSPTYTLVEQYHIGGRPIYHFDLYRLSDPEELTYLGLDDYLSPNALCLIEWPEQAHGFLPEPDLMITLSYKEQGRQADITAISEQGYFAYQRLKQLDKL